MGAVVARPPIGEIVVDRVAAHWPWGIELELLPPWEGVTGTVDLIYITDVRPFSAPGDFPSIGTSLDAVVTAYAPSGQLRLSTRDSELDPVRGDG